MFDPTHFADMTGGRVLHRIGQPDQAEYFQLSSIKQIASAEVRKYPLKTVMILQNVLGLFGLYIYCFYYIVKHE